MNVAENNDNNAAVVHTIRTICREIRNELVKKGTTTTEQGRRILQDLMGRLRKEVPSAETIARTLAGTIFSASSNSGNYDDDSVGMTNDEALSVLTYLARCYPEVYLKPASRAVRDEARDRLETSAANGVGGDEEAANEFVVSPSLLSVVVAQLGGEDVEVASNASETLVACCKKLGPDFASRAADEMTSSVWNEAAKRLDVDRVAASTVAVRCANVVVEIMSLNDDPVVRSVAFDDNTTTTTNATGGGGAVSRGRGARAELLLRMLTDPSDPLTQMSVLDMMEKLANVRPANDERCRFLFSDDVLNPLLVMSGGKGGRERGGGGNNNDDDDDDIEPDPILGGPALRVVAALCKLGHKRQEQHSSSDDPSSSSWYDGHEEDLLSRFHRSLRNFPSSGELDRLAVVDAVSSFASASERALDMVLSDPITRDMWLSLSSVAQPKLKSVILTSVAMVLDPPPSSSSSASSAQQQPTAGSSFSSMEVESDSAAAVAAAVSDRSTTTTSSSLFSSASLMKLYSALGSTNGHDRTTELVLKLCKSPVPETRLASYNLFRSVAAGIPATGGQVLLMQDGFLQFILSRDEGGESTKEGREAKYDVVRAIRNSAVMGLLAQDIVQAIENYLKEGPHYVKAMSWELATD